jgi:hypothetical protein
MDEIGSWSARGTTISPGRVGRSHAHGADVVDKLARLRGFMVTATGRGFGESDNLDEVPQDELDLAYWTSISRGM